jgi:hypothetical protein
MTKTTIVGLMMMAAFAVPAAAQVKTITGEMKTATATVEAIERNTREVTLKGPDGKYVIVVIPPEVKKFDAMKVGDTVTVRYHDNVVLRLKAPGEPTRNSDTAAITPNNAAKPGGTVATQRTITVTITAIDMKVPSITFTGPNNWTYSSKVEDKEALSKVKVGDKIDITWTEALAVSVDTPPAKK